jgi:hypothetical protein
MPFLDLADNVRKGFDALVKRRDRAFRLRNHGDAVSQRDRVLREFLPERQMLRAEDRIGAANARLNANRFSCNCVGFGQSCVPVGLDANL